MPRTTMHRSRLFPGICLLLLATPATGLADDWPMWRHDSGRGGVTSTRLPDRPEAAWSRELGTPSPAWPKEQDYHGKLEFDRTYQPIVLGRRIIVPSMAGDSVTAYDTRTGRELWRFYADGPVRFAPVGGDGRVYFTSDDGHLYCVGAEDGALRWKVRGGPDRRSILGNERLISSWPARGAPVLADGTVYFGAGIWPFMGIFLLAVDAESGEVLWTNSGTGAIYNLHQHGGADAFGGVAPQGYMAVRGDHLIVGGGLTVPAVFDRRSGRFLAFEQSSSIVGKGTGGYDVAALGPYYFNGGLLFHVEDGLPRLQLGSGLPLLTDDRITALDRGDLVRFSTAMTTEEVEVTDRRGNTTTERRHSLAELGRATLPMPVDRLLMQAGSRIIVLTAEGTIAALEWSAAGDALETAWEREVSGTVDHVLAADGRLFAVTEEGWLHCFAAEPLDDGPRVHRLPGQDGSRDRGEGGDSAEAILAETGKDAGIALVWGIEDGALVEGLASRSNLHVIAVDADRARVDRLRRRLDDAGLYGRRVHVIASEPSEFPFPPYLAELVVSERLEGAGWGDGDDADGPNAEFLRRLFHALRPYGGIARLPVPVPRQTRFAELASAAGLANAEVETRGDVATLTRVGPLPGAGQWTHQYGSAANTVDSGDALVKAPLGLLWFGGPTNFDALPRHGQGPIPQVAGGRLVIEGVNSISARCVYTGRTLWRREFPNVGFPYKANNHTFSGTVYINNQPGANFIGGNYVSLPDAIYVVYRDECHRLDPADGETVATFRLPSASGEDRPTSWGYLGVSGDYLVAGASPQIFDAEQRIGEKNWNATSSERVVVMDRHTGAVLWSRSANHGFRHNAIVPAGGMLFLIDRLSDGALDLLARRGRPSDDRPRLSAHDLATGEELWSGTEDVFGTWLGYSEEHGVLIQGGRTGGREHLPDEPSERIIAYRGADGEVLWDRPIRYTGPLVIRGDRVISSGRKDGAVDLLTGEVRTRRHPVTGEELPWTHTRTYGCGTVLACENLLTFRSGAAGFFDLANDGGTGNFGGFKAGCTPNLVPADGVLNAPDYTRTCSCSYQNQTSLAMVHRPDVETWTYSTLPPPEPGEAVRRIGINLNAPGDRIAEDGTLWVEFPSVAGPSPDIPVTVAEGEVVEAFRNHSSLLGSPDEAAPLADRALPWVAASGVEGEVSLELALQTGDDPAPKTYTVRLHFVEPDDAGRGQRVFDVSLQGDRRDEAVDVVELAAGRLRPIVREYPGVPVTDVLRIDLRAAAGGRPPVLSGIEVVRED